MSDTHYFVDVTQTITTTYEVPKDKVADSDAAAERYPEYGLAVHSEAQITEVKVVEA